MTQATHLFRRAVALLQARDPSVAAIAARTGTLSRLCRRLARPRRGPASIRADQRRAGLARPGGAGFGDRCASPGPGAGGAWPGGRGGSRLSPRLSRSIPNFPPLGTASPSRASDKGDHAEAAEAYAEALRLRPDFHEAALNLGVALQEAGRLGGGARCLWRGPAAAARELRGVSRRRWPPAGPGALWLDPAP